MAIIAPGYLLTWHTYATWLHGDSAGSVDRSHNRYATPRLAPSAHRATATAKRLSSPPLILSAEARDLVDAIIREHCRRRDWELLALAVRSNHVHVVIGRPTIDPEPIVKQLKDWGTRTLRSHSIIAPTQRAWADHASTIYLFEPGSLDRAIDYVLRFQDNPLPGHTREP